MNRILGIDPGIKGGIALLSDDGLIVEKMPVIAVGNKTRLDIYSLKNFLNAYNPHIVVVEQQQVMPKQGIVSGFSTGINYGLLMGLLFGMEYSCAEVRPSEWKKSLRVSANKDDARYRAMQLFPKNASDFSKKSDDGLAEAALIAYYYKTRNVSEAA